jgi:hypothetical protein
MTPIRELADKIAAAVVACVNHDLENYDMLVLNNIEQVIGEGLISHGGRGLSPSATADWHLQMLELIAEARLCCDAFLLGADSLLIRQTLPAALAELTALKRMAERSADAMMALQAALQSDTGSQRNPPSRISRPLSRRSNSTPRATTTRAPAASLQQSPAIRAGVRALRLRR